VDPSGEIVEFKNGGVPWKDHLSKLEVALEVETPIQFVIFPDGKGKWRVQAVPIEPKSFILRLIGPTILDTVDVIARPVDLSLIEIILFNLEHH